MWASASTRWTVDGQILSTSHIDTHGCGYTGRRLWLLCELRLELLDVVGVTSVDLLQLGDALHRHRVHVDRHLALVRADDSLQTVALLNTTTHSIRMNSSPRAEAVVVMIHLGEEVGFVAEFLEVRLNLLQLLLLLAQPLNVRSEFRLETLAALLLRRNAGNIMRT